jgi:hypothetical protein
MAFGEDVVEVVYSPSRLYREVITRDRAGLFRVHDERWWVEDPDDPDAAGAAFWCPYDRSASITDTIENARTLAAEALRAVEPPRRAADDA